MIKLIRIQDKDGRGPYRPGFSQVWSDPEGPFLPPIFVEFGWDIFKSLENRHGGCAFRSMDQLKKWFSRFEIERLLRLGFKIVEMEVDEIIAESENQIVFARSIPLRNKVRILARA